MTAFTWNTPAPPSPMSANLLSNWVTLFQDVDARMLAAGFVQTADTGQLDISTISSFLSNSGDFFYGYKMYALNDSLQDTLPVYIKAEFGSGPAGNATSNSAYVTPKIRWSFGVSNYPILPSDGSGNLSSAIGTGTHPSTSTNGGGTFSTSTNVTSYCTYNENLGFYSLIYGPGMIGALQGLGTWFIQRTIDETTGLPNADGVCIYYINNTTGSSTTTGQAINSIFTSSSYTSGVSTSWAQRVGGIANTQEGTTVYLQRAWMLSPRQRPCYGLATYNNSNLSAGSQFPLQTLGTETNNFVALGSLSGYPDGSGLSASFAMLFE